MDLSVRAGLTPVLSGVTDTAIVVNMPREPSHFTIRDANDRDAAAIAEIVDAAF